MERHGHVKDLKLYRDPPRDNTLFTEDDLFRSLSSLGYVGGPKEETATRITIFFDFNSDDPNFMLKREPNLNFSNIAVPIVESAT